MSAPIAIAQEFKSTCAAFAVLTGSRTKTTTSATAAANASTRKIHAISGVKELSAGATSTRSEVATGESAPAFGVVLTDALYIPGATPSNVVRRLFATALAPLNT